MRLDTKEVDEEVYLLKILSAKAIPTVFAVSVSALVVNSDFLSLPAFVNAANTLVESSLLVTKSEQPSCSSYMKGISDTEFWLAINKSSDKECIIVFPSNTAVSFPAVSRKNEQKVQVAKIGSNMYSVNGDKNQFPLVIAGTYKYAEDYKATVRDNIQAVNSSRSYTIDPKNIVSMNGGSDSIGAVASQLVIMPRWSIARQHVELIIFSLIFLSVFFIAYITIGVLAIVLKTDG